MSVDDRFEADTWMYASLHRFGIEVDSVSKKMAMAVLTCLKDGQTPEEAAVACGLMGWKVARPSSAQVKLMKYLQLPVERATTPWKASLLIDAKKDPLKLYKRLMHRIDHAHVPSELDAVDRDLGLVRGVLGDRFFDPLLQTGIDKRREVGASSDIAD